jgi:hypothetical protein
MSPSLHSVSSLERRSFETFLVSVDVTTFSCYAQPAFLHSSRWRLTASRAFWAASPQADWCTN